MAHWYHNAIARASTFEGGPSSVRAFHRALPGYAPTPLVDAPALATEVGVARLLVKDESARMGLGAFKILGASWACHRVTERRPGTAFVTATDGNHGRAVARTAADVGTTATVFVPVGMPADTASSIESEGASVVRVDGDYDAAVAAAARHAAADPGRALVQDMAWPGYVDVPQWIVDGYGTLLEEVDEVLGHAPDLVVVPAGVGSLAQGVVAHYRRRHVGRARVLVVEPDSAAAVMTSLVNGRPASVRTGTTVMAGMNCGTISTLAWPVLRDGCDAAVLVTDADALRATADLAAHGVRSGPCGAATLAGLRAALHEPRRRADLDLPDGAVVVLLSTEGP
jgi:diaminopropionate ammonia-lyase